MDLLRRALFRLASLWRNLRHRREVDDDLDREVRAAFEQVVDEHVQAGMEPAAARRLAVVHLGPIESIQAEVRDTRTGAGLAVLWQDARFGVRLLRRSPLFAVTAVLSLAGGIGANATIFSLVNVLMLRDLRVDRPDQLVEVDRVTPRGRGSSFSYPAYQALRDQNKAFSGLLAMSTSTIDASIDSAARPPAGRFVSGNFFAVLGVSPAAGRLLSPGDDAPGAPEGAAVAVITQGVWQRSFGGRPDVVGQALRVDAVPFSIVGVLPEAFDDPALGHQADFYIPTASEPRLRHESWLRFPDYNWLAIVGRLRPGLSLEVARLDLDPIFLRVIEDLAASLPDADARRRIRAHRLFLDSARGGLSDLRRQFARPLLLLMGAVGLVLLIACANVVNLLLARGVARRREIALRLAIGASRGRLVRQLLTEAVLLGIAGGALGLVLAIAGAPLLVALVSDSRFPIVLDVRPGAPILLFTGAVGVLSSLVAGVMPSLRGAGADVSPVFQDDSRSISGTRSSTWWGRGLIVVQVALSLLLVVGAGLLVQTLRNIRGFNPGFDAGRVLLIHLNPVRAGYTDDRLTPYYREVLDRVRRVPGVEAASVSAITPVSGGGIDLPFAVAERAPESGAMVYANRVSEGFMAAMGTPVRLGRDFTARDAGRPGAAIINEALARRYFRGENPIGRHVVLMGRQTLEVVGVAANAKYLSLREKDPPTIYLCAVDDPDRIGLTLAVRTSGDPSAVADVVRRAVQSAGAAVPLSSPLLLSSQVEGSLVRERLVARLLSAFAVLALLLAAVGLYGVLGYSVSRRTGEIGVRLALGATPGGVLRSVLRECSMLVAIGSLIGLPAAMMLSRLLSNLLYGVTTSDPGVLAGAVSCLILVALAAGSLPAWRASRVDPLTALRHD